ncbi:MAG: EAL domain-containing protein, partial [Bullifex sp.]|nr:EAL domain-containing protein [Bullifex sp.]
FLDRTMIRTVREELEKLHEYGYRCTLDDFGSGFSSLGLLTDFPIDCLKIDKSFMDGIFSDKTRMVVSSIINLASSLSIDVVAEGVENSAQLDILKEIGGRVVQGYVYSRPMTCGDWRRWLDEFGGGRAIPLKITG